jgi:hypothetical protein
MQATQGQQAFIFDDPFNGFAASEFHGLGNGRGEIDVPLLAGLTLDELDFGRETHMSRRPFCV